MRRVSDWCRFQLRFWGIILAALVKVMAFNLVAESRRAHRWDINSLAAALSSSTIKAAGRKPSGKTFGGGGE
jgi:hypothetical protein